MPEPIDLSTEAQIIEAAARVGDRYLDLLARRPIERDDQLWICRVAYAALMGIEPRAVEPAADLAALPDWLRDLCGRPET